MKQLLLAFLLMGTSLLAHAGPTLVGRTINLQGATPSGLVFLNMTFTVQEPGVEVDICYGTFNGACTLEFVQDYDATGFSYSTTNYSDIGSGAGASTLTYTGLPDFARITSAADNYPFDAIAMCVTVGASTTCSNPSYGLGAHTSYSGRIEFDLTTNVPEPPMVPLIALAMLAATRLRRKAADGI